MGTAPAGVPMLRPLSVGEILDASFKVYGRNFLTMAKAIIVVAIPFSLLSAVIRASIPVVDVPGHLDEHGHHEFDVNGRREFARGCSDGCVCGGVHSDHLQSGR
jgi:hypothetical protein